MRNLFRVAIISSIVVASMHGSASRVLAHSTGLPLETVAGAYLIDVGTDAEAIIPGASVRFDFELKDAKTEESKNFAQAWVRITNADGTRTWLATGLHRQPVGPSTLLYIFDQPGAYTLNVSFRDDTGDDIATTAFPLTVKNSPDSSGIPLSALLWFVAGLVVGALGILTTVYRRLK